MMESKEDLSRSTQTETTKTVAVALAVNLGVTALKVAAGLLTGSAAMLTEAAHSLVDCTTEGLLMAGEVHGRYWAKGPHLWGALAAVSMFVIGGCWGVYEGVSKVFGGGVDAWPWVALAVLAISALMELTSWRTAYRTLAVERDGRPWLSYLRTTTNTSAKTVLVEDSSDIGGDVLAMAGIGLGMVTGSPIWDGLASALIGLLLVGLAFDLGRHNLRLLLTRPVAVKPELVSA
jgi:cation diffusion facilitator family transporter